MKILITITLALVANLIHNSDCQTALIKKYLPIAKEAERKWGVPASINLAFAITESGCGSELSRKANNLHGRKYREWIDSDWYGMKTRETYREGDSYLVTAKFAKYSHPDTSFMRFARYIRTNPAYAQVWEQKGYGEMLLVLCYIYATDPKKCEKVWNIIDRYDLTKYDTKIKITKL